MPSILAEPNNAKNARAKESESSSASSPAFASSFAENIDEEITFDEFHSSIERVSGALQQRCSRRQLLHDIQFAKSCGNSVLLIVSHHDRVISDPTAQRFQNPARWVKRTFRPDFYARDARAAI